MTYSSVLDYILFVLILFLNASEIWVPIQVNRKLSKPVIEPNLIIVLIGPFKNNSVTSDAAVANDDYKDDGGDDDDDDDDDDNDDNDNDVKHNPLFLHFSWHVSAQCNPFEIISIYLHMMCFVS